MRVPKKETKPKMLTEQKLKQKISELTELDNDSVLAVFEVIDEFVKEIPEALIYETPDNNDGYDHDDVWIMMDLIKEWLVRFE